MMRATVMIAIMAVCTAALRFLPFLIYGNDREIPGYLIRLGRRLPPAIIGMLVIYCLRDVSIVSGSHGIPELAALILVGILHVWKRNSLLSILGGTVFYMFLVQVIF